MFTVTYEYKCIFIYYYFTNARLLKIFCDVLSLRTGGLKPDWNQKVLRPATSTQAFVIFLYFQANSEMVRNFQVATASFSYAPLDVSSSKLHPYVWKEPNYFCKLSPHNSAHLLSVRCFYWRSLSFVNIFTKPKTKRELTDVFFPIITQATEHCSGLG
jgi:hypothetical protein